MSTRLVILGLLREKPLYGYEIKHIIEDHMGDWTSIAFGSIYFALDKLSQEELVEKVATEQEGRRPSRSVYQITQAGQNEFLNLLRGVWQNVERQYFDIDIAMFFLPALPINEVRGYLKGRLHQYEGILKHLTEHETEQMQLENVPEIAREIFNHTKLHTQAELEWTRSVLARLETD